MVKYIFNTYNCQGCVPYSKKFGSKKVWQMRTLGSLVEKLWQTKVYLYRKLLLPSLLLQLKPFNQLYLCTRYGGNCVIIPDYFTENLALFWLQHFHTKCYM